MAIKAFRFLMIFLTSNNHFCAANSEKQYSTEEKNYLHVSALWQLTSYGTSSLLWVVSLFKKLNFGNCEATGRGYGFLDTAAILNY